MWKAHRWNRRESTVEPTGCEPSQAEERPTAIARRAVLCHAALWSVQCACTLRCVVSQSVPVLCCVLCTVRSTGSATDRQGGDGTSVIASLVSRVCGCECRGFEDREYRGFAIIGIEGLRIVNVEVLRS